MSKTVAYNPLVSIITPVLNGNKYLEICLQSVLNQSYPYIEQIFVDGGSTDGSLEILADYHAKYPNRIRFISEPDKGVGEALNKGLKMGKGEIFGWLDTDDIYERDAIMTVVEYFRSNPAAYFVFGNWNIINGDGELIRTFHAKDFNLKEAITDKYYLSFCSAFYKREVIEHAGLFNTLGNDLDFWIRVAKMFKMYRIEKVLSSWREHKDNISGSKNEAAREIVQKRVREDYVLCRRYGGNIFSPRSRRYWRHRIVTLLHGIEIFRNKWNFIKQVVRNI